MNMNIDDGDARGVTGLATEFVLSLPRWLGFGRRHEHSLVTTAKGAARWLAALVLVCDAAWRRSEMFRHF
jgi:hypothetical protein